MATILQSSLHLDVTIDLSVKGALGDDPEGEQ